jgi:hypothetical protein
MEFFRLDLAQTLVLLGQVWSSKILPQYLFGPGIEVDKTKWDRRVALGEKLLLGGVI